MFHLIFSLAFTLNTAINAPETFQRPQVTAFVTEQSYEAAMARYNAFGHWDTSSPEDKETILYILSK